MKSLLVNTVFDRARLEIVCDDAPILDVERDWLSVLDHQDQRPGSSFGDGDLIEDVRVVKTEHRNQQVISQYRVVHLLGDDSRAGVVVSSGGLYAGALAGWLNDEIEQVIRMLTNAGFGLANWADDETAHDFAFPATI